MIPNLIELNLDSKGKWPGRQKNSLQKYGIYFLLFKGKIIRVGESASGISRIKKGFREPLRKKIRNKIRTNYIAYSWRTKYSNRKVLLHYFPLNKSKFKSQKKRRALEAELTFQLRLAMHKWPDSMSEIHFLEKYRKDKDIINNQKKILKHYKINCKKV